MREQGKVTSVTWGDGLWRMRMVDGEPVTEISYGTTWSLNRYALFPDALTAYKVLVEGMAPPEGFEVECEGGRITEVARVREERRLPIVTRTGDQECPWYFVAFALSSKELAEITPILAEIAKQESLNDADD